MNDPWMQATSLFDQKYTREQLMNLDKPALCDILKKIEEAETGSKQSRVDRIISWCNFDPQNPETCNHGSTFDKKYTRDHLMSLYKAALGKILEKMKEATTGQTQRAA